MFNINDAVFYIEQNWYLEEVKVRYAPYQEFSFNKNKESEHPFYINAVKHITERECYSDKVNNYTVYDLYYVDENGEEEIIENIDKSFIYVDYYEAVEAAKSLEERLFE